MPVRIFILGFIVVFASNRHAFSIPDASPFFNVKFIVRIFCPDPAPSK